MSGSVRGQLDAIAEGLLSHSNDPDNPLARFVQDLASRCKPDVELSDETTVRLVVDLKDVLLSIRGGELSETEREKRLQEFAELINGSGQQ
jgi:hypothetical protein